MRTVIVAAAIFVAWVSPAHADPISLLTAAFVWLLPAIGPISLTAGAGFGIATGTFLLAQGLAVATLVAGFAAGYLFGPSAPGAQAIDPGQLKEVFEGQESPEINAIGRVRIGGVVIFGNTTGADRYRLIGQCKGPIDLVEETYLGGQEVVLDPNTGVVTSNPYTHTGVTYVYVWNKIGDGTETAWSQLTAAFPTFWTAAHRVRGIAQGLVKYISPGITDGFFAKLYQSGLPPLEQVMRARLIYDPRTETTQWSDNGILCALHVMLTWPEFALADFDLDYISEQANLADALVATKTGTEKRSRCSGVWTSEMARGDVMEQLLRSIGAEIVPRPGNLIGIALIDDDRTVEVTIPIRHLVDLSWRSGPESVERQNLARLKYYSRERNFEMSEIDLTGIAWSRNDDEIEAVGEKALDIDLPFCPSASQAQRIARRLFATSRADVGIALTNLYGLAAWGTRCVDFEFPDEIGTLTCAIGPPRVRDNEGQVEIPFVVWPALATWNPDTDEADAPGIMPDLAASDPLDTPAAPTGGTVVESESSPPQTTTRIRLVPVTSAIYIEASYREMDADGEPVTAWKPMTEHSSIAGINTGSAAWVNGFVIAYVEEDLSGVPHEFRVRFRDINDDRGTPWSATFSVTPTVSTVAPAVPTIVAVNNLDGTATITVTAPESLQVATVVTTGDGAPGTVLVKPGDEFSWNATISVPNTYTWTAEAFNSNDNGSGQVSDEIIVP